MRDPSTSFFNQGPNETSTHYFPLKISISHRTNCLSHGIIIDFCLWIKRKRNLARTRGKTEKLHRVKKDLIQS